MKIVVDIGCIECGESTDIVGVFDDDEADRLATALNASKATFQSGQHSFEAFPLPPTGVMADGYAKWLEPDPLKAQLSEDATVVTENANSRNRLQPPKDDTQ